MAILRRFRNREQASGRPYRFLALEVLEDRLSPSANPFTAIANYLAPEFSTEQGQLSTILAGGKGIPFIGNALGSNAAGNVIEHIYQPIDTALRVLGADPNSFPGDGLIRSDILAQVGALGLANITGSNKILSNIYIDHPAPLNNPSTGASGVVVEMLFDGQLVAQGITFNTGLPSLPIQVTATVTVTVNYHFEFGFQYDANPGGGPSFVNVRPSAPPNPVPPNPLTVKVTVIPNINVKANFGFLGGAVTTTGAGANGLNLVVTMNKSLQLTPSGSADMHLKLAALLGPTADYPSVDATFYLTWNFTTNTYDVGFDGVTLNPGNLLNKVLMPILDAIQTVTEPLEPVLEAMQTPLPGISDISNFLGLGDITLETLAGVLADNTGYGALFQLAETIAKLITEVNSLPPLSPGGFQLGGLDLSKTYPNLLQEPNALPFDPSDPQGQNNLTPNIAAGLLDGKLPDVSGGVDALTQKNSAAFSVNFPILEDPASAIIGMLLGKDADLVSVTADVNLMANQSPPGLSFAGEGITFQTNVSITGHLTVGYDTFGIRKLISDLNNPAANLATDLAAGLYVDGSSNFHIAGGLGVGPELSFGIFDLKLAGGISTGASGVNFSLNPNQGKIRFVDFTPANFVINGTLDATLVFTVSIGVTVPFLGFVGFSHSFGLADDILVDLNYDPQNPPVHPENLLAGSVTAAGVSDKAAADGTLTLFVGTLASDRAVYYFSGAPKPNTTDDGGENYTVTHVSGNANTAPYETVDVSAFGVTQRVSGVREIEAQGDLNVEKDLTITVQNGVTADAVLGGGGGTAHLTYSGSGRGTLFAGNFDSVLIDGNKGSMYGRYGNDTFSTSGDGDVSIFGGSSSGGQDTYIIQAPSTATILPDPNKINTLELTVSQTNENITVTPSNVLVRDAANKQLASIQFSDGFYRLVIAGGGGTNLTFNDMSKTTVGQISVGITPPANGYSSGKTAAGGIRTALNHPRGNTVTVNGYVGQDDFGVRPVIDPTNKLFATQVQAGPYISPNGTHDYVIWLDGLSSGDSLVLNGEGHGDFYDVTADPLHNFGTSINDDDSASDHVTLDASALPTGSVNVTDVGVTLAHTYLFLGFPRTITNQELSFDGNDPGALVLDAPDGEDIVSDRAVGTTLLNGGSGHDTFNVSGTTHYTLDGGMDSNDYTVNWAPYSNASIFSNVRATVNNLTINDSANSAGISTDYTITSGSVTRVDKDHFKYGFTISPTSTVTFAPMNQVTLDTNTGAGIPDSIHIEATAIDTATTINEGSGRNYVYVSQAQQNLDLIVGPLTIAGSGYNRVLLYDNAPILTSRFRNVHQITVTPTTLTRASVPFIPFLGGTSYTETIHYSGVSEIDLFTPATGLTVDTVDPSQGTVIGVTGALERSSISYNYGGYQVTGSLLPAVLFGNNLTSLNVNESGYGVNFDVYDTPTTFPTTLQTGNDGNLVVHGTSGPLTINGGGGPGPNNVYLGGSPATFQNPSPQGSLAAFQGAVTISGQSGLVVLDINYSADTGLHHALLTAGSLSGAAPTLISFGGIVALTIHSDRGQGSDFTVAATPAAIKTVVDGGPGVHTFYVQSTQGPLDINTGTGDNNVQVGTSGISLRNVGALTVTGGVGGKTTLDLNDQANVEGGVFYYAPFVGPASLLTFPTYVITDQRVTRNDSQQYISPLTGQAAFATVVGTVSYKNVASLSLSGGQTPNIFDVQSTAAGTPVTIRAGTIVDTVNVGSAGNTLDKLLDALTVVGRPNTVLNVNDQGATAGAHYSVTSDTVARPGAATITYESVSGLVLNTAAGSNTIDVQSTFTGLFVKTLVTVNTGTGTNTVNAGTPGKLLNMIDYLTVNGGAGGATTLNLDDQANADGNSVSRLLGPASFQTRPTYLVTDHSVTRSDAEVTKEVGQVFNSTIISTIDFQNLAGLTLNGGTTTNVFNVQGTAAGSPVTINAGKSTDIVNVGDPKNTIDGLLGLLTVNGQKNTVLNVNDEGTTTDETYSLTSTTSPTSTTLTRSAYPPSDAGGEMISYHAIASLVVHGGSGNNLFGVTGTPIGTAVTLYGGTANSDQFVVGDSSDLDSIHGSLTLHGQTAYSFAVFSDLVNAGAQTYTLTGNTLQRTGMADITFDGLDQVALYAGTGQDTVNVVNTLAATPVSIFTNGGNDSLNVSPVTKVNPVANDLGNIAGSLAFDALAGTDTLNLDDQSTNTLASSYVITASSVSRPGMAAVTFSNIANVFIQTKAGKLAG